MDSQKRIFIAALNWGLGHATRCIPLIRQYQAQGALVTLASDGAAGKLLQAEFPELTYQELPSYAIQYPKKGAVMMASILSQLPKLASRILQEKKWLYEFLKNHPQDLIISDNRYGLYHEDVESVIICHQLSIPIARMKGLVNGLHKRMIERFDACWIPDDETRALSGELSQMELEIPVKYLGPLSRFSSSNAKLSSIPVLAILSGPEPQRSMFEEALVPILSQIKGARLIRGVMEDNTSTEVGSLRIQGYALTAELEKLLDAAVEVICRSGYSSIMDLSALDKAAILIPTPGQPEQEYLARHLSNRSQFKSIEQDRLSKDLLKHLMHDE